MIKPYSQQQDSSIEKVVADMPEVDVALPSHLLQQTKTAGNHRETPSAKLCQPQRQMIDETKENDEYRELLRLVSSSFVNLLLKAFIWLTTYSLFSFLLRLSLFI